MSNELGSGIVHYELRWPIQFGSETITKLEIRRPKGKDLRKMRVDQPGQVTTLDLISRLTGQPSAVVDEMDSEDIEEVGEIIKGFTLSGRKTGDEPTQS
jgi:hypothetical protein